MCPRCESRARKHPTDPEYIYCFLCGDVPVPGLIALPYVAHSNQRKHTDASVLNTCADCGAETSGRGKRCKNCAGKGARV